MVSWVADYTARIAPSALKSAGVVGVCRYVSRYTWKVITRAEYQELRAAGIEVVLNFEDAATDWLGGSSAGKADATFAVGQAQALGYPTGSIIAGSADFDMTAGQWSSAGRAYAIAFRDTLGARGYEAGVYGPWDVLGWCEGLGGYRMFWQAGMSTAWSGGRNARLWPGADLRQRRQLTVGGVQVDYNDILHGDWTGTMATVDDAANKTIDWIDPRVEAIANMWPNLARGLGKGSEVAFVKTIQAMQSDLASVKAAVATLQAGGVDQAALNQAIAAVMNDPAWLNSLAAALAKHIQIS